MKQIILKFKEFLIGCEYETYCFGIDNDQTKLPRITFNGERVDISKVFLYNGSVYISGKYCNNNADVCVECEYDGYYVDEGELLTIYDKIQFGK